MENKELDALLAAWPVRVADSRRDEADIRRRFYAAQGAAAVRALEKNGFAAQYCPSRQEAAQAVLALIPPGARVGVGDSHTIYALELDQALADLGCQAIPGQAAMSGQLRPGPARPLSGPQPGPGPGHFGGLSHIRRLPAGGQRRDHDRGTGECRRRGQPGGGGHLWPRPDRGGGRGEQAGSR